MELHEVRPRSWVRIVSSGSDQADGVSPINVPIGSPLVYVGDVIFFHNWDGMYSSCVTQGGKLVHPAAWTEVELVDPPLAVTTP